MPSGEGDSRLLEPMCFLFLLDAGSVLTASVGFFGMQYLGIPVQKLANLDRLVPPVKKINCTWYNDMFLPQPSLWYLQTSVSKAGHAFLSRETHPHAQESHQCHRQCQVTGEYTNLKGPSTHPRASTLPLPLPAVPKSQ
eukprot:888111-Pelagomonas_calceolata.AAC.2